MIIVDIHYQEVERALKGHFDIAGGQSTSIHAILVKIHTDDGIIGIGEAVPMPAYSGQTIGDVIDALNGCLIPALLDAPIESIEGLHQRMNAAIKEQPMAKAALDIAYHDVIGKMQGVPVYQLLGGAYRKMVPLSWAIGLGSPETIIHEAQEAISRGFRTIKIKIGLDAERDLEVLARLRESIGPDIQLRVDANEGYDYVTARSTLQKMQAYTLQLIEQPLPRWDVRGIRDLRSRLDTPILADESLFTIQDAMMLVQENAADLFNIKLMKLGGLRPALKFAAIAEAAGIPCMVGSMPELGVATMAGVHFAKAIPGVSYPCELIGPLMAKLGIVAGDLFSLQNEEIVAIASSLPGLGLDLLPEVEEMFLC